MVKFINGADARSPTGTVGAMVSFQFFKSSNLRSQLASHVQIPSLSSHYAYSTSGHSITANHNRPKKQGKRE